MKKIIVIIVAILSLYHPQVAIAKPNLMIPEIINMVNSERTRRGIAPLVENKVLSRAAQNKTNDEQKYNYFSHTSPFGLSLRYWLKKEGYQFNYAGENLAKNYTTAKEVVNAWMKSPTHKANILDKDFKEIGIGVTGIYVAQYFGSSR